MITSHENPRDYDIQPFVLDLNQHGNMTILLD